MTTSVATSSAGGRAGRGEGDQRHDPDQELRREHLPERDEGDDGGGRVAREPLRLGRAAREAHPDGDERHGLHDRLRDGDRVRQRPDEVLRACAGAHRDPEPEQLVRDEQQAAPRLSIWSGRPSCRRSCARRPAGASTRNGTKQAAATAANDAERDERLAPSLAPPDPGERERQQDRGVELRREGGAERRRRRAGRGRAASAASAASASAAGQRSKRVWTTVPISSGKIATKPTAILLPRDATATNASSAARRTRPSAARTRSGTQYSVCVTSGRRRGRPAARAAGTPARSRGTAPRRASSPRRSAGRPGCR